MLEASILLAGTNDEILALKAVQEGAQDCLIKEQISGELLVRTMRYAIERQRSESDRLSSPWSPAPSPSLVFQKTPDCQTKLLSLIVTIDIIKNN
jgi:hypothetical protein